MADLAETFASLRKAGLSLNPNKCIFGVHKGKVLGCLVSTKGIEANPDKVKSLWNMEEPKSIRDVQKLTGRIAALNRFIPRYADRSLPFFKVLRNANKFEWGPEQSEALKALKNHLQNMVKMTSPDPKDCCSCTSRHPTLPSVQRSSSREKSRERRSSYLFTSYPKLLHARSSCTQS